jgi:ribonuclease VapC
MIVLDSSVLIGIVRVEGDATRFVDILATEECVIGAPTLVEARAWCSINLAERSSRWLEQFVDTEAAVVPFSREMADEAFAKFGKGSGHAARLNFGDCMAYAVAMVMRAPLLFKGSDFGLTDVTVHPASIQP